MIENVIEKISSMVAVPSDENSLPENTGTVYIGAGFPLQPRNLLGCALKGCISRLRPRPPLAEPICLLEMSGVAVVEYLSKPEEILLEASLEDYIRGVRSSGLLIYHSFDLSNHSPQTVYNVSGWLTRVMLESMTTWLDGKVVRNIKFTRIAPEVDLLMPDEKWCPEFRNWLQTFVTDSPILLLNQFRELVRVHTGTHIGTTDPIFVFDNVGHLRKSSDYAKIVLEIVRMCVGVRSICIFAGISPEDLDKCLISKILSLPWFVYVRHRIITLKS